LDELASRGGIANALAGRRAAGHGSLQRALVGVLTRGDLSAAQPAESTLSVHEWRALLEKVTVSEVMSRDPLSIEAEAMALEAAQLMLARGVSGLPVTVGGKVVGVITESDLFRLLIAELSNAAEADPGRSLLICYHCGAALRRRPPITIGPDDECWRCHYHLHRCENCRYFDGIGCMLGRAERQAPVPGRSCEVFAYLPPRNMGVKR
jgi:CBS domain-containing protein